MNEQTHLARRQQAQPAGGVRDHKVLGRGGTPPRGAAARGARAEGADAAAAEGGDMGVKNCAGKGSTIAQKMRGKGLNHCAKNAWERDQPWRGEKVQPFHKNPSPRLSSPALYMI